MNRVVSFYIIRGWLNSALSYLKSEVSPERYSLIRRGNMLITTGSLIAIIETLTAIYIGLHKVPIKQSIYFSLLVLFITAVLSLTPLVKKSVHVWYEWAGFAVYAVIFVTAFSVWEYRLGELRLLAVINAITTITILLFYINLLQAFIISSSILVCYYNVAIYSIKVAGQPGTVEKEIFLCFSLVPAFILITFIAYYMDRKRNELLKVSSELEKLNNILAKANIEIQQSQVLTDIEMKLAGEIQDSIFTGKIPDITGWDLAFKTVTSGAVSGDFYDFYTEKNSLKGISLFDVSGHGVAPGLITILVRPMLFKYFNINKNERLGKVIESANVEILGELDEVNPYITGIVLRINGDEIEYINAGHPDLLYLKARRNTVHIIKDSSDRFKGAPIGIASQDDHYRVLNFEIKPGDFLIFFSDGLTGSRNDSGEPFGTNRLIEAIKSSNSVNAAGKLDDIMNSLNSFTGRMQQPDDITLFVAGKT